ncbi:UNVERIFIED_CONTAM: hypothetical protein FKN15_005388 [Acipenser sinensis]
MAGKLRVEDMKSLLLRLDGVNRSLDSMVMSLEQSSEHVKKSLQSQTYLNQSIQPLHTAFVPPEDLALTPTLSQDAPVMK